VDLNQLVATLLDYVRENWNRMLWAAVSLAVGWYLGRQRARAEWQRREFLHRLNISLNVLRDGTLRIRTIAELSCEAVFLNKLAVATIDGAARRTTPEDPLLPLPQADYWYYLNAVLNEVAERFAEGHLRKDIGLPVDTAHYLLCLTSERDGEMRTRKIRAMLIRRELLQNLPQTAPQFESPTHAIRWRTLQQMAKAYLSEPYKFLEVELCV
jgi:hypothetical protein